MAELKRFFCNIASLSGNSIIIEKEEYHHLCNVFRARTGDKVIVCFGDGTEYLSVISKIAGSRAILDVLETRKNQNELGVPTVLFQATLRSDKMELIIQKAVELGICEVVPFTSRYVVGSGENKNARYRKIAVEAVKQCRRAYAVEVCEEISFSNMIARLGDYGVAVFCDEAKDCESLHSILNRLVTYDSIAVIVGSEGGFSDEERVILRDKALSVTLGKRILRAETAAIAALSIISSYLDYKG